jgi:hypothetical protein
MSTPARIQFPPAMAARKETSFAWPPKWAGFFSESSFDSDWQPRYDRIMLAQRIFRLLITLSLAAIVLAQSSSPPVNQLERIRAYTRAIEFDYVSWTLNAIGIKIGQSALGLEGYLLQASQSQTVLDYLQLISKIQQVESAIRDIYADPTVTNPQEASNDLSLQLANLRQQQKLLGPLAENVLESQVSTIAAEMGLTFAGQPIPPVSFQLSDPPNALIVSPRDVIRQDADISISPDLTIDQITHLEDTVDLSANVSSLVVGIGGIGVYPTMVMETTDINWLAEVVSHEWTHNFLTLRPLGASYLSSPELRTMNETTASIAGKEIGRAVVARYYPELLPPPPTPPQQTTPQEPSTPPVFDFNAEMRETRVTVDKLLADGKIDEAEAYMEQRRVFFWDHGYHIRKINQAYFAFYGAYADQPGGAAGSDPVGTAVRTLRTDSSSLAQFVKRISWMWSFEQLQQAVQSP